MFALAQNYALYIGHEVAQQPEWGLGGSIAIIIFCNRSHCWKEEEGKMAVKLLFHVQ